MTAVTLRMLLAGCLVAMYILAMLCLRRRPLSLGRFIAWGMFALFVPALGPFLAILNSPSSHPVQRR